MATFSDDFTAIRALATYLQSEFAGTYAANYSRYKGLDVVLRTDEAKESQRVGKPYILIEQESGDRSEWSSLDSEYRMVTAVATATATDKSGAVKGVANPVVGYEQASRDLIDAIHANYATLRGLGLQGIEIQAQRQVSDTNEKSSGEQRIPHRITFHYHRA